MYTQFFGLKEPPFSIAPNPQYLFMSDRHREALSHLTYGLGETGGFVLLTGEVGTGKTTISRHLMAQLPDNMQCAFILNPTLSSQELLATLCDELKIKYRKTGATLKTLTDKIQEKLLKNQNDNINTLLIIDEAQHLQPEVLEQLRLLTNLETNTKKLLQVILIGQPELQQLLKRRDLRQLAQRITARYHLIPLTKQEVTQYIQHRLSVAECYRAIFNKSALAAIHKLSQGIPRLINLLCERSLMIAYNNNDTVVNKKTVMKASVEALGEEIQAEFWWQKLSLHSATNLLSFTILLLSFVVVINLFVSKNNEAWLTQLMQLTGVNDETSLEDDKNIQSEGSINDRKHSNIIKEDNTAEQVMFKDEDDKSSGVNIVASSEDIEKTQNINEQKSNVTVPKTLIIQTENKSPQAPVEYHVESVDGVSNDLLARFESAIKETKTQVQNLNSNTLSSKIIEQSSGSSENTQSENAPLENIPSLYDMPSRIQQKIPALNFEQHIYNSEGNGWVQVNGRDRYEGDKIAENLWLEQILPQQVILIYQGESFSLPALVDWQ